MPPTKEESFVEPREWIRNEHHRSKARGEALLTEHQKVEDPPSALFDAFTPCWSDLIFARTLPPRLYISAHAKGASCPFKTFKTSSTKNGLRPHHCSKAGQITRA